MANIVIATLDQKRIVIGFMQFDSEHRLDQVMVECKKKGLSVKTMTESEARTAMIDETPIE